MKVKQFLKKQKHKSPLNKDPPQSLRSPQREYRVTFHMTSSPPHCSAHATPVCESVVHGKPLLVGEWYGGSRDSALCGVGQLPSLRPWVGSACLWPERVCRTKGRVCVRGVIAFPRVSEAQGPQTLTLLICGFIEGLRHPINTSLKWTSGR